MITCSENKLYIEYLLYLGAKVPESMKGGPTNWQDLPVVEEGPPIDYGEPFNSLSARREGILFLMLI